MQRVKPAELHNYEGKLLARDIFYNGTLLFKNNSLVDKSLINRVNELSSFISSIFIYNSEKDDKMLDLLTHEIMEIIYKDIDLVFNRYSFMTKDDSEIVKNIVDFFIKAILEQRYFQNYLENIFLINEKSFSHIIRVTVMSLILSIKTCMSKDIIYGIGIGALLHEIGKQRLFVEFPILADKNHIRNLEENIILQSAPIVGYNEVLHNDNVPLNSKKIILMCHVWENFESSYDHEKKLFNSYPEYYESHRLSSELKNIGVNIVQIANCFDRLYEGNINETKDYLSFQERIQMFDYIEKNKDIRFSTESVNLFLSYISIFSVNDKVLLSNGKKGTVHKHTNNVKKPVIELEDGNLLNLSEIEGEIHIVDILEERSEHNNETDIERYNNTL